MVHTVKCVVALAVSAWSVAEAARKGRRSQSKDTSGLLRVVLGGAIPVMSGGVRNPAMEPFRGFPPNGVKFLTAASHAPTRWWDTQQFLSLHGIRAEWIPVHQHNCAERTKDPKYIKMVEDADAIFISGGQSGRVSSCLFGNYSQSGIDGGEETPFLKALRAKAIVGGSSAGAMTQPSSEILITAHTKESYEAVRQGSVFQRDSGNNLIKASEAIDTHFSERGRQGRLMVFAMQTHQKWAFGVDEGTAYFRRPSGEHEVAGPSGVVVFQDTEGTSASQSGTLHYLTHGDRINPETGRITFNSDKSPCQAVAAPAGSNAVFNRDENAYKNVSIATAKSSVGTSVDNFHGNPPVQVTFHKTASTIAMCGPSGESFSHLWVEQFQSSLAMFANFEEPNVAQDYIWPEDE